jgi:hypothetical protein
VSTPVVVGLVALLVLGGGAVVYAATRKKEPGPGADVRAISDDYFASLPTSGGSFARENQDFGNRGLNEGPRARAMRDKDRGAVVGDVPQESIWGASRTVAQGAKAAIEVVHKLPLLRRSSGGPGPLVA